MSEAGPRAVDLHDPAGLVAADGAALLPSAALAGAQVRSVADQLADWRGLDRPRAMVVVGATAVVDTALLTALIGDRANAPIVTAASLPGWVGPLDVVVVLASSVDDFASAAAADQANRRGARVVVRAAAEGPVAAAAGAALLGPRLSVTEALAAPARLAVLVAVAAAAGLYPRPDFAAAADQLDAMAVACHPSSEFFVNPALTLAEHLSTGLPLVIGTDEIADALANHACRSLAAIAGMTGGWLDSGQAALSPPVLATATTTAGPTGTFYDPFDDDQPPGQQLSTVLVVGPSAHAVAGPLTGSGLLPPDSAPPFGSALHAGGHSPLASALEAALPRALCIGPEELPSTATTDPVTGEITLPQRDALAWTLALLSRIDFACVYLALLTRARPPVDSPDGLGRIGQAVQHLPPAGGRAPWSERESGSWS